MRIGTIGFRLLLAVGWAILFYVTFEAVRQMGAGPAGKVFLGDFAHPWRAQFNTDFSLHLILVALWMIYRSRPWIVGLVFGLLAIVLGGVFTLAYLLVV
ncbi:MAG TPA: hypothetical protein VMU59_09390, partial [Caulobacteraceae bacterium]|nr:hypothetical protein [Caulobacteraceae bacterium]